MDVNLSRCLHCGKMIHYSEARLLPGGGGVCHSCADKFDYERCEECQDYFISDDSDEHFCELCLKKLCTRFSESEGGVKR